MSKEYLPLKVDPFRFADNETHLQGSLPIKNMQRLCASLAEHQGEIEANMRFGVDEQGIRYLSGHLATHLSLQCQRCMKSFDYEIIDDFKLGIVQTEEEANNLPERYDPLVINGPELFIQDVIEDELIVSLPIVPMHEPKDCEIKLPFRAESDGMSELEKDNPFKVIELLRTNRDKKS